MWSIRAEAWFYHSFAVPLIYVSYHNTLSNTRNSAPSGSSLQMAWDISITCYPTVSDSRSVFADAMRTAPWGWIRRGRLTKSNISSSALVYPLHQPDCTWMDGIPQIPCSCNCLSAARSIPPSIPDLLFSDAQPHRGEILCNHEVGVFWHMTRAQARSTYTSSIESEWGMSVIRRHVYTHF